MRPASAATALAVVAAVAIYAAYHFLVLGLPLIGTPMFRIDYVMATVARGNDLSDVMFALYRARPVAETWIMIASFLGRVLLGGEVRYIAYGLQHLAVLAYFFMTAHVMDAVFRVRLHRVSVLAAWVVFLQFRGVMEAVYKLESIVGTLSMLFGGLALLAMVRWERTRTRGALVATIVAYAACVFSKEDFLLPPLLLLGWFALRGGWRDAAPRMLPMLAGLAGVIAAFLVFNKLLLPTHSFIEATPDPSSHYFMTLAPDSMIRTGWAYATRGTTAASLSYAWFAASLLAVVLRVRWKETLWIGLVVGSLMGPYVIMPNHQFSVYVLKWLPWEALAVAMLLQCLAVERIGSRRAGVITAVGLSIALSIHTLSGISSRLAPQYHQARYLIGNYTVAQRLQTSLLEQKDVLNGLPDIAVLGVGPGHLLLSPWQNRGETAFWLKEDLGLSPRWTLYIDKPGDAYQLGSHDPSHRVSVRSIADLPRDAPTHAFVVARNGDGRLVDLRGKDLAGFAASYDLRPYLQWKADSRYRVAASPESVANCPNARSTVGVEWDFSALGTDKQIDIYVQGPGGKHALWARTPTAGKGVTGPWASPGMKIEFMSFGTNTPLARIVLGELRCPAP